METTKRKRTKIAQMKYFAVASIDLRVMVLASLIPDFSSKPKPKPNRRLITGVPSGGRPLTQGEVGSLGRNENKGLSLTADCDLISVDALSER